jgi:GNAT superfamily N-acetyltransferase
VSIRVVVVAQRDARISEPRLLQLAEPVHRQLRPQLEPNYAANMERVFAGGGEMCVALDGEQIAGLALFRVYENTFLGQHLYVDDLVTDEGLRSRGVGKALLDFLSGQARERGCKAVTLDSGTQRERAHAFYFREGFTIRAFHFVKPL